MVVSEHVYKTIDALPVTAHPMTQFATGVMALQVDYWSVHIVSLLNCLQPTKKWLLPVLKIGQILNPIFLLLCDDIQCFRLFIIVIVI